MRAAFVDTSVLVAEAFDDRPRGRRRIRLEAYDILLASRLLDVEFRCACRREDVEPPLALLEPITFVEAEPERLPEAADRVLTAGDVRGADCWHLANALLVAPTPGDVAFLTYDVRQRAVAKALGFES